MLAEFKTKTRTNHDGLYPRGTHEAEATGEVVWWDRTRAENITITITKIKEAQPQISLGFFFMAAQKKQ